MPALAPREARLAAFVLALAVAAVACAPSPRARAAAADRAHGTAVYGWLLDHDPSALALVNLEPADVVPLVRTRRIRVLAGSPRDECRTALAEHALLVVLVARGSVARDAYEDCGYALERDRAALVIAPR